MSAHRDAALNEVRRAFLEGGPRVASVLCWNQSAIIATPDIAVPYIEWAIGREDAVVIVAEGYDGQRVVVTDKVSYREFERSHSISRDSTCGGLTP